MSLLRSRSPIRWLVVAAAIVLAAGAADAGPRSNRRARIDEALKTAVAKGAREARVIITLDDSAKSEVRKKLAKYGRDFRREHKGIRAASMTIPVAALGEFQDIPGVDEISVDAPMLSH